MGKERKLFHLATAAVFVLSACGSRNENNEPATQSPTNPSPPVINSAESNPSANPTISISVIDSAPLPPGQYITNNLTGSLYEVSSDPSGSNNLCVKLSQGIEGHPQTVIGAITAFNDPSVYNDFATGSVYDANNMLVGNVYPTELPSEDIFGNVPIGTTVCINY